jgi:hypothetical protein
LKRRYGHFSPLAINSIFSLTGQERQMNVPKRRSKVSGFAASPGNRISYKRLADA